MLRLSKKADYALMAMKGLALRSGATMSAREVAEEYGIPLELMAKVMQRLAREGLLVSQQGTRGGYQLARGPRQISVREVIEAIDGPISVTACSTGDDQCDQFSTCNIRDPLWRIKDRILLALETFSVAELATEVEPAAPLVWTGSPAPSRSGADAS